MVLMSGNARLQAEQNIMTNLAFAVDSMTREIRTGTNYFCRSHPNTNGPGLIFADSGTAHEALAQDAQDCLNGNDNNRDYHGLSFIEGGNSVTGNSRRILYFHDKSDSANQTIKRKVGNSAPQQIVSSGVDILELQFHVEGACPLRSGTTPACNGDYKQPTVTIYLRAADKSDPSKEYYINTTVTQRTLDL